MAYLLVLNYMAYLCQNWHVASSKGASYEELGRGSQQDAYCQISKSVLNLTCNPCICFKHSLRDLSSNSLSRLERD